MNKRSFKREIVGATKVTDSVYIKESDYAYKIITYHGNDKSFKIQYVTKENIFYINQYITKNKKGSF